MIESFPGFWMEFLARLLSEISFDEFTKGPSFWLAINKSLKLELAKTINDQAVFELNRRRNCSSKSGQNAVIFLTTNWQTICGRNFTELKTSKGRELKSHETNGCKCSLKIVGTDVKINTIKFILFFNRT